MTEGTGFDRDAASPAASRNAETVRRCFEAFAAGDHEFIEGVLHPDAVLDESNLFPDSPVHRTWQASAAELSERWRELTVTLEGEVVAGNHVIAYGQAKMVGPVSGAPVSQNFVIMWQFRGDQVVRLEAYRTMEDAVNAAKSRQRGVEPE